MREVEQQIRAAEIMIRKHSIKGTSEARPARRARSGAVAGRLERCAPAQRPVPNSVRLAPRDLDVELLELTKSRTEVDVTK